MHSFLIITTLFLAVSGRNYGLLHFSKDEFTLSECLENHESLNLTRHSRDIRVRKVLVDFFAQHFSGKTKHTDNIYHEIVSSVGYMIMTGYVQLTSNQTLLNQLQEAIKKALVDCSDESVNNNDSSNTESID